MNGSRISVDKYFTDMASLVSRRGTCLRRRVGCVLTNSLNHVLATGYNGVPSGFPHCNELVDDPHDIDGGQHYGHACAGASAAPGTMLNECNAIHAEQNAMIQCRDVDAIHTCYSTASPCVTCLRMLLNTSCRRIVFLEEYPHPESRIMWQSVGREWVHFKEI
jgi:dCMP deaminase